MTMHHYSNPEILRLVGERLRFERLKRGWTLEEFASRSRVDVATAKGAEEGEDVLLSALLRLWRALQLLDEFGVPASFGPPPHRNDGQPATISPLALLRELYESGALSKDRP
jgi:transcriptional regulator with XRE-family HTH domain